MNRIIEFLERASRQHHVVAMRDGMIASVPIILIGSVFLLLGSQGPVMDAYFPGLAASPFGVWYKAHFQEILWPYRLTMGLLGLYVAFTIASSLAKQYNLPTVPQGIGAVAAFMVAQTPVRLAVPEGHPLFLAAKPEDKYWMLGMKPLGAEGMFLAIVLAILMVELSRLILRPDRAKPVTQEQTGGIPPAVIDAFKSFLPMLLMVTLVWLVVHAFGFELQNYILRQSQFLGELGDTLTAVIIVNVLLHLFQVAGVHGISIINAVMFPIWQNFVALNAESHASRQALEYVTAYPFFQWFVWIGGAGATLAPTVYLLFSKNAHMRRIGRISIVPSLFNVNEPFIFGLPVVANPILAIPCIIAPVVCGSVAFLAMHWGLVGRPFIEVPWILPCFLGAPLCTQDWRALVLLLLNLGLSLAIWFPFLKIYEHRLSAKTAESAPEARGTEGTSEASAESPPTAAPPPRTDDAHGH